MTPFCYDCYVKPADIQDWIDRYVDAWRSSDSAKLANIFSNDISYRVSPWKPPLKGLLELEKFWEQARTGPDEIFELQSYIVAIEDKIAVVRIEVKYANDTPSDWRDLWIITFDENSLCVSFEEWPFSSEQEDGQSI